MNHMLVLLSIDKTCILQLKIEFGLKSVSRLCVGWLFLGLTALSDSISVYIGPSSREREKEEK